VALLASMTLAALVVPAPIVVASVTFLLAAIATDAWLVRRPVSVSVELPPILSRGVPAPISVAADGPRVRIYQPGTADLLLERQEDARHLQTAMRAVRRGEHRLPAAATRTTGALGLGSWHHRAGTSHTVVVYPDMPAARQLAMQVRLGHFREEGRRTRGPLGLGTDLESIREYQPDDDIRQVNWSATARMGTPMSNTFRVEQDREVMCILDCGRLMAAPIAGRTRLDAAVDAVAAMAAVADTIGDRIGVVAFAERVIRRLTPRRDGGEAVVKAIFDLEPRTVDSDYELAFRVAAASKRAFILILTDLLEETAAIPLVEGMGVLARHHFVTVASVIDDEIAAMISEPASSTAEALRTAAAVEVMEARGRVGAALRSRGATIIEAAVGSLSSRCVGAYLRAKATARF
jgi:uncharacterized protein (DUF58 family)